METTDETEFRSEFETEELTDLNDSSDDQLPSTSKIHSKFFKSKH